MLLRVISSEGELFNGSVEQVSLPTEQGVLGILPGHMNIVSSLLAGNITYISSESPTSVLESFADKHHTISVSGGLMMIEDDVILVAAE